MKKRKMNMQFGVSKKAVTAEGPMESPFEGGQSFSLYLEPMLNSYWKSYMQVLTLNVMPVGDLGRMVMRVNFPRLSPFQEAASPFYDGSSCVLCLMRYPVSSIGGSGAAFRMGSAFMGADDIGAVFAYLESHGYVVERALTSMVFEGNIPVGGVSEQRLSGNRKLIAMVRYVG